MSVPPSFPQEENNFGPVPNYLVWAIIITIGSVVLCCVNCVAILGLIPGIVAIVYASQVKSRLAAGDRSGALAASRVAKIWCWVTTGILILACVIAVAAFAFMGVDGYVEYLEQMQDKMQHR